MCDAGLTYFVACVDDPNLDISPLDCLPALLLPDSCTPDFLPSLMSKLADVAQSRGVIDIFINPFSVRQR